MLRLLALATALLPAAAPVAAEPVTVLGLPLGGQISPAKQCPQKRGGTDYRTMCWVHSPVRLSGGTKWGMLGVPGADDRPKWAAYAMFDARVTKAGILESVDVLTTLDNQYEEIRESVAGRFGRPNRESLPASGSALATWESSDINIRLACTPGSGCKATFEYISAESRIAAKRALDIQRAKDAARPSTP